MHATLLADPGPFWGYSVGQALITLVVLAAILAIAYTAIRAMGTPIPQWVLNIFWIVVIAFVAVFAIKLVLTM